MKISLKRVIYTRRTMGAIIQAFNKYHPTKQGKWYQYAAAHISAYTGYSYNITRLKVYK